MRRNNTQTQNTQNGKQNIQNNKTKIKRIKQVIRTTKSKIHKANSNETMRRRQDILYSNPHANCITVSLR